MFELLLLFGLGLGVSALIGGDDDDAPAPSDEDENPETFTENEDAVVDDVYRPGIVAGFDDLVMEGEITQTQANQALNAINFVEGPQNIETGGGDDIIVLHDNNDTVDAGAGDDVVLSAEGDDVVNLGAGNDAYGVDFRTIPGDDDFEPFPVVDPSLATGGGLIESVLEAGDDTISGGAGDDAISDSFGANLINGQQGADFIVSVDHATDQGTADTVKGGFGFDTLVVDEGDVVETGNGQDSVIVETYNGVDTGYDVVTVTDFEIGKDMLALQGEPDLLGTQQNGGISPVTISPTDDGLASIVSVNGIAVVRVEGGAGLTLSDIEVRLDSR